MKNLVILTLVLFVAVTVIGYFAALEIVALVAK